eukprot:4460173-Alexandrium_andersonii.AAC.1
MGEDACTQQLGEPQSGACPVRALSTIERRPSRGGSQRALKGLCGGGWPRSGASQPWGSGPRYDLPRVATT